MLRMLIRAAVLWEAGAPLSVEEVELGEPQAGEVRVRVVAAGVCRSDLHVMEGVWTYDLPMVLGHEGAGIVDASTARPPPARRSPPRRRPRPRPARRTRAAAWRPAPHQRCTSIGSTNRTAPTRIAGCRREVTGERRASATAAPGADAAVVEELPHQHRDQRGERHTGGERQQRAAPEQVVEGGDGDDRERRGRGQHRAPAEPVHHRGQHQRRAGPGSARCCALSTVGIGAPDIGTPPSPPGGRRWGSTSSMLPSNQLVCDIPNRLAVAGLGDVADARGVVDGVPVLRDGRQLADAAEHRGDPEAQRDEHGHGDARVRGAGPVGAGRRAFRRGPAASDEPPRAEADGADQDRDDGERRRRPADAHRGAQRPGQPGDRVREQWRRGGEGPAAQAASAPSSPPGSRSARAYRTITPTAEGTSGAGMTPPNSDG